MNKIYSKEIKYKRNHKFKKELFKYNKYQNHLLLNGFNIIELNEEESNLINIQNSHISEEEIQKIKKKAYSVENYYSNKSEESTIKENCFNCLLNGFNSNELLYFNKKKDLLIYLKYCFYFLRNILFLDEHIYIKNRYDLEKCDINYLKGWKFFIPKTVCRSCFLQIVNMDNLFQGIKNIFIDISSKQISKRIYIKRRFKNKIRIKNPLIKYNNINNKKINKNKLEEKYIINIPKPKNEANKSLVDNANNYLNENHSISSYPIKNDRLSIKNDIFGKNGNLNHIDIENDNKAKIYMKNPISKLNEEINNRMNELNVIEIKINENEFIDKENIDEKNEEHNKNNNYNKINKNGLIKSEQNKINNNYLIKHKNTASQNIFSTNDIKKDKFQINENEKIKNSNKPKINMYLYYLIFNKKHISNKIIIKLFYKLNVFKDILLYLIIHIEIFKEKIMNYIFIKSNIISNGIHQYEKYFFSLYNEASKVKKNYDDIINKVMRDSIPTILSNILKLKGKSNIRNDEIKILEEMKKKMNDYYHTIEEMKKKYDILINHFFGNFVYLFKNIEEIKDNFKEKN